jgi:hypothetical protein
VPEPFLRVQWTRLFKGLPSPQFVEQVQRPLSLPHKPVTPTARAEAGSHAPVPVGRLSFPLRSDSRFMALLDDPQNNAPLF